MSFEMPALRKKIGAQRTLFGHSKETVPSSLTPEFNTLSTGPLKTSGANIGLILAPIASV
jgi:hypothetical protein